MSEFKYACPVCGQHIKCDSSQAGTVMECPTCFQKITVPQAPSGEDQKLILTGTVPTEKLVSTRGLPDFTTGAPRRFPGVAVVLLFFIFVGTAVAAIYWATLILPRHSSGPSTQTTNEVSNGDGHHRGRPELVAPPANDTNWSLDLNTNTIPSSAVVGRIHGKDFIVDRATYANGSLSLRSGTRASELMATISFSGAQAAALSGHTINVTTNAEKAARVTVRWKAEDGQTRKENYDVNYALRLEFGELERNRLPGKIYLCLPDEEKSYLVGAFRAEVRKPRQK